MLAKAGIIDYHSKRADPKVQKKLKNLKQFLKKKRSIHFYISPAGLFKRQSLNRTYIENISSNPTVYWTLQVKFIAMTRTFDNWYVRGESEAEVIMN